MGIEMKIGEETSMDLFARATAVDTEKTWISADGKEWPLWHIITGFYEDEEPVLAAGTKSWPMGEGEAEEIAAALRYIARARDPKLKRCESCKHWCNSVTLGDNENSGQCRADPPKAHIMTGQAVWPFSEDTDWCSRYFRDPAFEETDD